MSSEERLVKNKKRVRQHGEVFTPVKIVNDMLDMSSVKDKVEDIRGVILEPSAGEGIFLVEILKRRLNFLLTTTVELLEYENKALLALSTLYGIELLEDNAQRCVMNLYICFYEFYSKALTIYGKKPRSKILDSAKTIISANIIQGNFLTRQATDGSKMIFSEWKEVEAEKKRKNIVVIRTEYTLEEILDGVIKGEGVTAENKTMEPMGMQQLSLFDFFDAEDDNLAATSTIDDALKEDTTRYKYVRCQIADIYREEMEAYEG